MVAPELLDSLTLSGNKMSIYALINVSTAIVENIILWDGNIETWQPEEGYIAIQSDAAQIGWSYIDGEFIAPPAPEVPPPTPEQILASQSAKLSALKSVANAQKTALTNRIGELNDAVEYEVATAEEIAELSTRVAQRKLWGLYSIDLGRVTSQAGWPPEVTWPVQPIEGMDLTVSAVAPDSLQLQ